METDGSAIPLGAQLSSHWYSSIFILRVQISDHDHSREAIFLLFQGHWYDNHCLEYRDDFCKSSCRSHQQARESYTFDRIWIDFGGSLLLPPCGAVCSVWTGDTCRNTKCTSGHQCVKLSVLSIQYESYESMRWSADGYSHGVAGGVHVMLCELAQWPWILCLLTCAAQLTGLMKDSLKVAGKRGHWMSNNSVARLMRFMERVLGSFRSYFEVILVHSKSASIDWLVRSIMPQMLCPWNTNNRWQCVKEKGFHLLHNNQCSSWSDWSSFGCASGLLLSRLSWAIS